jgi:hypothetical protein
MQTRSQSKNQNLTTQVETFPYKVEIDFDEASEAWKANKISIGNGSYRYLCAQRGKSTNNLCIKKCLPGEDYCAVHYKMLQKKGIIRKIDETI